MGIPLLFGLTLLLVLTAGCQRRQSPPVTSPPPPPPALTRVGVVDLQAVARAHPRWKELDALGRQVMQVESQLAQVPQPLPISRTDVHQALDQEAKRMRAEFEAELGTLRQESTHQLETFADALRKDQQAKLEATGKQLEMEARQAVEARRDELRAQLHAAEQVIMEEYRYPVLNLRLRAEVAGLTSEEEGRQLLRQLQALQQERDERIQAKAEESEKVFKEYQKAKEVEINERLKAVQAEMTTDGQNRLAARQREVEAEFIRMAAERQRTFQERLERRRRQLLATAEAQMRGQQETFLQEMNARARRLRAELTALQEQRARLEESILAEVKIEVATIAQEYKLDVVLTRYITSTTGIDITSQVVQKFKR